VTGYLLVASACLAGTAAVGARRLRRMLAVVTVRGLAERVLGVMIRALPS
jgi:hypothetical protein